MKSVRFGNRSAVDFLRFYSMRLQHNRMVGPIRNGLTALIPVALIGSFALALRSFPVPAYQQFLESFCSGLFVILFDAINRATFGMMSIYATVFISLAHARSNGESGFELLGSPIAALGSFVLLAGFTHSDFQIDTFGIKGMFTAVLVATIASFLSRALRGRVSIFTEGANIDFNHSIASIVPSAIIIMGAALFHVAIHKWFGAVSLHELFITCTELIFNTGSQFLNILLYILLSSLLWFFGIHGSNALESLSEKIFTSSADLMAMPAGSLESIHKNFVDIFVAMGGCGSTFCLFLAILLFSKSSSTRGLCRVAFFPLIFNINELLVFGLPIVLNFYFFIPFVCVPLVNATTTYAAMALGWLPSPSNPVTWTTPVLLGGYISTASYTGVLLQLFNITLGVMIYAPFVSLYDRDRTLFIKSHLQHTIKLLKDAELNCEKISLLRQGSDIASLCRLLTSDLRQAIRNKTLQVYYQPQYNHLGKNVGCEALLRWNHPEFGMIYPPLIVKLAEESNLLEELECFVIEQSLQDSVTLRRVAGGTYKMSVNITCQLLFSASFCRFLDRMASSGLLAHDQICLEITEGTALVFNDESERQIEHLRAMGYLVAIDDFSMGHTSLNYLKHKDIDLIKLDGSLVRDMLHNTHCHEIISSVVQLAKKLHIKVLAEYVETESQRAELEAMGCRLYQGYLYSPAVPIATLLAQLTGKARLGFT